jgi:hypothetical protein
MGQVKIVANEELIRKFKQIALIKHGKLNLTVEGEEALRLYIDKHKHLIEKFPPKELDPLNEVIGAVASPSPTDALRDLKRLEKGEL